MTDSTSAVAPFDHAEADIILRSSDNIDFRVFKLFLSLASPFFAALFNTSKPTDVSEEQQVKDGLVVVPVAENSKTFDILLRFCYPCTLAEDPELEVLKDALDVLRAARKYSLHAIEKRVRQAIANSALMGAEPLRCFAIAHKGRLRKETLRAAKHTLTQPLIPACFQEINMISAADLLALLTYHKKCGDALYSLRSDPLWIASHYGSHEACSWLFGQYQSRSQSQSPFVNMSVGYTTTHNCDCPRSNTSYKLFSMQLLQWWDDFMEKTFIALRDRPCKATVQAAVEKTIQDVKALNCVACSPKITEGMRDFSDLLTAIVDIVVSQIKLELNF